jgi:hypothetical protein
MMMRIARQLGRDVDDLDIARQLGAGDDGIGRHVGADRDQHLALQRQSAFATQHRVIGDPQAGRVGVRHHTSRG